MGAPSEVDLGDSPGGQPGSPDSKIRCLDAPLDQRHQTTRSARGTGDCGAWEVRRKASLFRHGKNGAALCKRPPHAPQDRAAPRHTPSATLPGLHQASRGPRAPSAQGSPQAAISFENGWQVGGPLGPKGRACRPSLRPPPRTVQISARWASLTHKSAPECGASPLEPSTSHPPPPPPRMLQNSGTSQNMDKSGAGIVLGAHKLRGWLTHNPGLVDSPPGPPPSRPG